MSVAKCGSSLSRAPLAPVTCFGREQERGGDRAWCLGRGSGSGQHSPSCGVAGRLKPATPCSRRSFRSIASGCDRRPRRKWQSTLAPMNRISTCGSVAAGHRLPDAMLGRLCKVPRHVPKGSPIPAAWDVVSLSSRPAHDSQRLRICGHRADGLSRSALAHLGLDRKDRCARTASREAYGAHSLRGHAGVLTGTGSGVGRSVAEMLLRTGAHVTTNCCNRKSEEGAQAEDRRRRWFHDSSDVQEPQLSSGRPVTRTPFLVRPQFGQRGEEPRRCARPRYGQQPNAAGQLRRPNATA